MSRWLRALVIALLIPVYALAAIGVAAVEPADLNAGQHHAELPADGLAAAAADLGFELGDTSDDVAEAPTARPLASCAQCLSALPPPAPWLRPPAPLLELPQRPPKAAASRD